MKSTNQVQPVKEKILQFGTFDIDNYGDLLFPIVARNRLKSIGIDLIPVSPTNCRTRFSDAIPTISFEESEKVKHVSALLVGGGNILRFGDGVYSGRSGLAYEKLWIGASASGMTRGIPIHLNNPGCTLPDRPRKIHLLRNLCARRALLACEAISIRDSHSNVSALVSQKLPEDPEPDTAFEISKIWPITAPSESSTMVVNLNDRYFPSPEETATRLAEISAQLKTKLSFVVIGACHDDDTLTLEVCRHLDNLNVGYNIVANSLESIARAIGESSVFIGSSMHGFITALSYRRPAILITKPQASLKKFDALMQYAALPEACSCNWQELNFERVQNAGTISEESLESIFHKLDAHWRGIVSNRGTNTSHSMGILRGWKSILQLTRFAEYFLTRK